MARETPHAIAACESECTLCYERIFEGDAVVDVGSEWAHLDCRLDEPPLAVDGEVLREWDQPWLGGL